MEPDLKSSLAQRLTGEELIDIARKMDVETFQVSGPGMRMEDTAILGQMNNLQCRSGLHVHATNTFEAHDLDARWQEKPRLAVALFLEGALNMNLAGREFRLDSNQPTHGHIWSVKDHAPLVRRSRKGMHIRKVIISLPPKWIRELIDDPAMPNGNLERFAAQDVAYTPWAPSRRAIALAEQIVHPARPRDPLSTFSADSAAMEIVREALATIIFPEAEARSGGGTAPRSKAAAIRRYIDDNLSGATDLHTMARALGMSVRAIQSTFKASYNLTVSEYARGERLRIARHALEQEGATIAQAAHVAGYTSAANFSTAFKRAFGLSPSDVRN